MRNFPISITKSTSPKIVAHKDFMWLLSEIQKPRNIEAGKALARLAESDKNEYKKAKESQYGFVIGKFSERNANSCEEFSPVLGFDVDHLDKEMVKDVFEKMKNWKPCFFCSPSVSFKGVRVLVWTDCNINNRDEYYSSIAGEIAVRTKLPTKSDIRDSLFRLKKTRKEIEEYLASNPHIDDKAKDVSRYWYYSGVPSEWVYLNEQSKVFTLKVEVGQQADGYKYEISTKEKIEMLVSKIERTGVDITQGITEWFKVGLSVASEFGHQGESYFHRVSQFHPDYDYKHADKEWRRIMSKQGAFSSVGPGTFFHFCRENGVTLDPEEMGEYAKAKIEEARAMKAKPSIDRVNDDIDSERQVIGCILSDQTLIYRIRTQRPKFNYDAFSSPVSRFVYFAIEQALESKKAINPVSVSAVLSSMGKHEIASSIDKFTSIKLYHEDVFTHVDIVYSLYVKDLLAKKSMEWQSDISSPSSDPFKSIMKIQSSISEISSAQDMGGIPFSKLVGNSHQLAYELHKASQSGDRFLVGTTTGFTCEDDLTSGMKPGDLITLAARPGMGKTSHALKTVCENAKLGNPVGIFSLEMSSDQLVNRMVSIEYGIRGDVFTKGGMRGDEFELIDQAVSEMEDWNVFIDDSGGLTISELASKARYWKIEHDIGLIVVDYLQLMSGGNSRSQNREQEISSISRGLKALAKELKIPIIQLSQLSRAVETRGGTKRPQLSDLRESGAIEQDSDVVKFLYRPEYYDILEDEEGNSLLGVCEVIYAKHRNGALKTIRQRFDAKFTRFGSINDIEKKQPSFDDDDFWEPNFEEVSMPTGSPSAEDF